MTTADILTRIDAHSCCIAGVRYAFKLRAARRQNTGTVGRALQLDIDVFDVDDVRMTPVAAVRVTAPMARLIHLPALLTEVLATWVVRPPATMTLH